MWKDRNRTSRSSDGKWHHEMALETNQMKVPTKALQTIASISGWYVKYTHTSQYVCKVPIFTNLSLNWISLTLVLAFLEATSSIDLVNLTYKLGCCSLTMWGCSLTKWVLFFNLGMVTCYSDFMFTAHYYQTLYKICMYQLYWTRNKIK